MARLNQLELKQLKSLLAGESLPVDAQINILMVLRSRYPKFLQSLPDITEEKLKDNKFLIKYLTNPYNKNKIKNALREELSDSLSAAEESELEESLNKPAAPRTYAGGIKEGATEVSAEAGTGQPDQGGAETGGSAGGGGPSLPHAGGFSGIRIHNIPHAPQETVKPDIAIAGSGGHVAEAGDPSKLVSTTSTGQIKEVGEPSKLVTADRTGGIKETGRPSQFVTPESAARGDTSKLVSSSGRPLKESVHSGTGKSVPSGRRFNTSFFRSSAGNVFKRVQNFASPANPFLKTNLNRIGQGFKSMFGNLGNAGGRTLLGGLNAGGNAANRFAHFRSGLGTKIRGTGNAATKGLSGGKKFALASMLAFVIFFGLAASGANISPGDAAPPAPVPPGPITPPGPKPPPVPPPPGLKGISVAAGQITALLYQTNPLSSSLEDRLFHNKRDEPGLYYWCTLIVVDAYNKAGFTGLTRAAHAGVLNMKSFFAATPGYQLLPPETPVEQLREGDVIFFEGSGDQHTSLVKSIEVSQEGNGIIRTFEANNVVLEDIVSVQNHKAISAQTTAKKFKITGFGQVVTQEI